MKNWNNENYNLRIIYEIINHFKYTKIENYYS